MDGLDETILVSADDILVVAGPDLANLRNAKNMVDLLKSSRPNDHRPHYCLNQVGVPKRPEITPADFAKALESDPLAVIPFEPQLFGPAANNGQMIAEMAANHRRDVPPVGAGADGPRGNETARQSAFAAACQTHEAEQA